MPTTITLSDTREQYRAHLEARGLAPNTIKNNIQVLNIALALWGNIQITSISGVHIDRLFRARRWSPATRNLYLSFLRGFFRWCRREGYMARDFDPTDGWGNTRVPRQEKLRIPPEKFPDLLEVAPHPRDRMVCALGLFTFCRGGELATLRISDVDLTRHELRIYRHKTREEDFLPISVELAQELDRWFGWYRQDTGSILDPEWYLVPSKYPNLFRQNGLTRRLEVVQGATAHVRPTQQMTHPYRAVKRTLAALGYPDHGEGEHTLRRSGARALFDHLRDQGYDGALMRVSSMLGHADVKVTQRYLGLSLERTQRNESIAGELMFGDLFQRTSAQVVRLRGHGEGGAADLRLGRA